MPGIWIYFKAKTALIEDGTLPEVKHPFDSALPYSELVREFEEAVGGRGQALKGMPIAGSTCSYTPLSRGVLWCPWPARRTRGT